MRDTYHLLKASTEFTLHADSPAVVFLKNTATHMVFFNVILLYRVVDASFFNLDNEHAGNTRKSHKGHINVHAQQHI